MERFAFSEALGDGRNRCNVCPHGCELAGGELGRCGVRIGGDRSVHPIPGQGLVTWGYGPIEEHPFYHFYPGTLSLSVGGLGCNARCPWCQNWELAWFEGTRGSIPPVFRFPTDALQRATEHGCTTIAFTYSEPIVWLEEMLALAASAKGIGMKTVLITNGFIAPAALEILIPLLDGAKIDLKAADEISYPRLTGLTLASVLRSLTLLKSAGIWCEVSTVLAPDLGGGIEQIPALAARIQEAAGPDVPWHLMRFFPAARWIHTRAGTVESLRRARNMARAVGMQYVYLSNVLWVPENDTLCPICDRVLAVRGAGERPMLPSGCPDCGKSIPGRGLASPC